MRTRYNCVFQRALVTRSVLSPLSSGSVRSEPDAVAARALPTRRRHDALHHQRSHHALQLRRPQHRHLQPRHRAGQSARARVRFRCNQCARRLGSCKGGGAQISGGAWEREFAKVLEDSGSMYLRSAVSRDQAVHAGSPEGKTRPAVDQILGGRFQGRVTKVPVVRTATAWHGGFPRAFRTGCMELRLSTAGAEPGEHVAPSGGPEHRAAHRRLLPAGAHLQAEPPDGAARRPAPAGAAWPQLLLCFWCRSVSHVRLEKTNTVTTWFCFSPGCFPQVQEESAVFLVHLILEGKSACVVDPRPSVQ